MIIFDNLINFELHYQQYIQNIFQFQIYKLYLILGNYFFPPKFTI